jgi:hypothetical protein
LNLEDEDYEEIVLAGFSFISLTPTMKERWTTEVKEDTEYQEIVKKVITGEKNVDGRLGIDEDRMLVWKGRLYVPNSFRKKVLEQKHN